MKLMGPRQDIQRVSFSEDAEVRGCSHITLSAEGRVFFQMLTVDIDNVRGGGWLLTSQLVYTSQERNMVCR